MLKGNSNLVDSMIRLECDMDNSIRRQSLSARYLMRAQQQKQQSELEMPQVTPSLNWSEAKNLQSEDKENCEEVVSVASMSVEKPTDLPLKIAQTPITAAQMAVEMIKNRKKTTALTNTGNSLNHHTHHTESSLNKARQSKCHHSQSESRNQNQGQSLKRSPSVRIFP